MVDSFCAVRAGPRGGPPALLALLLGWGGLACGLGSAPPIAVVATCSQGDVTLQIEEGHALISGDPEADARRCAALTSTLQQYRTKYELRFGHQELHLPIRLRAAQDLRSTGVEGELPVSGHAYANAIDLASTSVESLPHELHHLHTGPGHDGWCVDYEPWSEEVLGINQRAYLGCAPASLALTPTGAPSPG